MKNRIRNRIANFSREQLIDWVCLSCVDVREVRSLDEAQGFIDDVREALEIRMPVLEQQGGWISCDDRLPENKDGLWSAPVIALSDSGHVFTLSCQGGYWQRTEAFVKSEGTKVTHWQPLVYPDKG